MREEARGKKGMLHGVVFSMYNFTNRMSLACGMLSNEEYHALAR